MSQPPRPHRLNDYFCVVGLGDDGLVPLAAADQPEGSHDDPLKQLYKARVVDRYPPNDHEDAPFPSGVSLFAFPRGGLFLDAAPHQPLPTVFTFVHTDGEGSRMYGHVLTFFEPVTEAHEAQLDAAREAVAQTAADAAAAAAAAAADAGDADGADADDADADAAPAPDATDTDAAPDTTPKADATTPDTDAAPSRPRRRTHVPKCLVLISHWPYLDAHRTWLTQLYRLSLSPGPVPLERYVCNFVREVPAPPPGRAEVQYTIGHESLSFECPPANRPGAWTKLPFEALFETLDVDNVLKLWTCALLERQILVHSSQLSLLTPACEVLTSLLYPFQWQHVYIPVLPTPLVGVLNAPMPFLIGCQTSVLTLCADDLYLNEVVVVDLDNNTVTVPEASGPLPAPPPRRAAKLRAALRQHGGAFERRGARWAEDALSSWDHAFAYGPRPDFDESPFGDAAAASATAALPAPPQWPEVREAFLRFFVALLRDYRKHLVYPSKEEPEPVDVFANAAYLASQAPDSTGFLTELVAAQGFQSFCAARVSQDPEDSEVIFFDESIDAKYNRSRMRLHKRDTPLIDSDLGTRRTVVAPTPDLDGLPGPDDGGGGERVYRYDRWPAFDPLLFRDPRELAFLLIDESEWATGKELRKAPTLRTLLSPSLYNAHSADDMLYATFMLAFAGTIGRDVERSSAGLDPAAAAAAAAAAGSPRSAARKAPEPLPPPPPPAAQDTVSALPSPRRGALRHQDSQQALLDAVSSLTPIRSRAESVGLDGPDAACLSDLGMRPKGSSVGDRGLSPPRSPTAAAECTGVSFVAGVPVLTRSRSAAPVIGGASPSPLKRSCRSDGAAAAPPSPSGPPPPLPPRPSKAAVPMLKPPPPPPSPTATPPPAVDDPVDAVRDAAATAAASACAAALAATGNGGGAADSGATESENGGAAAESGATFAADFSDVDGDGDGAAASDAATAAAAAAAAAATTTSPTAARPTPAAKLFAETDTPETLGDSDEDAVSLERAGAASGDGGGARWYPEAQLSAADAALALKQEADEREATRRGRAGAATVALSIAFDVLNEMRTHKIKRTEDVYRALIDACGRCGNVDRAAQVLAEMAQDGIQPDASVYACLMQAFARTTEAEGGGPGGPGGGAGGAAGAPAGFGQHGGSRKLDWHAIVEKSKVAREAKAKAKKAKAKAKSDADTVDRATDAALAARRRSSGSKDTDMVSKAAAWWKKSTFMKSLTATSASANKQRPPSLYANVYQGEALATDDADGGDGLSKGAGGGSGKGLGGGGSGGSGGGGGGGDDAPEVAEHRSEVWTQQLELADRLLGAMYPGLSVATERETCPRCEARLSSTDIQSGWQADPNVYATRCKDAACGRKFVARFAVDCAAEGWVGSTGPATTLWCEWLSPWVLRKEVHTVLACDGAAALGDRKRRTIFWNLVVQLRSRALPTAFLLSLGHEADLRALDLDGG